MSIILFILRLKRLVQIKIVIAVVEHLEYNALSHGRVNGAHQFAQFSSNLIFPLYIFFVFPLKILIQPVLDGYPAAGKVAPMPIQTQAVFKIAATLPWTYGKRINTAEGKVLIEGTELSAMNRTQAAIFRRRKVGLVYQFYNLIPTLTVRKNILMPLLLDKRKPNKEYFEQIVHSLGIEDKLESLPNQLSGGQQQRVAIARSLIYRPALLLADEPTGNLDRKNGEEIIDLLKLSNRNLEQTILLITHDEKIALEADRVITIEDGKIVGDQKRR